jgi:hypothetical protein
VSSGDLIRKVRSRSWRELALFLEAFLLLAAARGMILLLSFQRITRLLGLSQGEGAAEPDGDRNHHLARVISWAVKAAARRTPWESACLAQGLTGMVMLSRRGGAGVLYLGVCREPNGPDAMKAHAWLRCGTVLVTGDGHEGYTAVSSFRSGRHE